MKRSKCGACTRRASKLVRAIVLTGPGAARKSRVCAACARLGWLLVFAEPVGATAKPTRRSRRSVVLDLLAEQERGGAK
jgi:hypothetical protein